MSDERRPFHKPTKFSSAKFENLHGADDPAETSRIAHETAAALLERVRRHPEPEVVSRLVAYTDENGIDAIAELWSRATAHSLPGALWRIYLIRLAIREDPHAASLQYQRGTEVLSSIDPVVAGAEIPTGPTEIIELADRILRGIFEGDFAVALERAAAFCRVSAAGCTSLADDADPTEPERATVLTRRALRFSEFALELVTAAGLWRSDSLD
ncbi:DNA-directed RNA polymerase subunit beta [Planctomonas sp. JC2975]|uniref:DNA-directed RNA polymerase subunit beta n=1 Tax=Planctomonas sp. JC2975 TaxID=2729626 RepID=UPI001473FA00|nr:DNA-directed RNA polymerase subunit beta [Planctomonas sp. JC2975]